jgi:tetratricopeptide (TPR) repeat protein
MRRIAAVLVGVLLAAPALADDPPTHRITRLGAWIDAVRAHQPGEEDASAYAVGAWPNSDIKQAWLDLQTLMRFVRCGTCGTTTAQILGTTRRASISYGKTDLVVLRQMAAAIRVRPDGANDLLERGAILHADVAMLLDPESIPAAPGAPTASEHIVVRGIDGRQQSVVNLALHWEVGRALLGLVGTPRAMPAPRDDATVRLWYRATMAYLQREAMHDVVHFAEALKLFPDDADVQFQNGCLHETLASPRVQGLARDATVPRGIVVQIESEHGELQDAERRLRRALELRPEFAEARLRLGRVLGRLGRHADAAAELRQILAPFDVAELNYYAALFRGGEERALGNAVAARQAYERAATLFPQAQAPWIALSQIARESGDGAVALQSIQHVLDLPADAEQRADPLWYYHFVQGRHADDLLEALYRPFRRDETP